MQDFKIIREMYQTLKSSREEYVPIWREISQVSGISLDTEYFHLDDGNKSKKVDRYVSDPTATTAVNQFGDYLIGILWGTGDKVFDIVPSRYVLEYAAQAEVEQYFDYITGQALYHMNHEDAGLNNAFKPYAYDQAAFGTSGIGAFPNRNFANRTADNALIFRDYGVDNICIDEGRAGAVDYIFAVYHWRVSRIVGEFCSDGCGGVDEEKVSRLPEKVLKSYAKGKMNDVFDLVLGIVPRDDFDPKLQGKRGTKYRGVWFLEDCKDGEGPFGEEDYAEKPIAVTRMIKLRGEVYGRSSSSMLVSTINAVNFMMATSIEILEKMANPALGIFGDAVFGDAAIDTSPNGLTAFSSTFAGKGNPIFPIYDIGDPSKLMQLIIPYLNDKIISAFKIDALLDFNRDTAMTATESMQRYMIRGKSLAGILVQQKTELLMPLIKRCISILFSFGELGIDPQLNQDLVARANKLGQGYRIIPDAVLKVMSEGRPWFELRFNNEMERMTRTESLQALIQIIQATTAIAAVYPDIINAVDWYKLLQDINNNLDINNQILLSVDEFKARVEQQAQMQQLAMGLQAGQMGAQIQKDTAQARKTEAEGFNAGR